MSTHLSWVQSLPPLPDLPLRVLAQKVVVLLALANADRSSDLQALDLTYCTFSVEGVEFDIPGLTKTRRVGHPPRVVIYAEFPDDLRLCPVLSLREYERRTRQFRNPSKGEGPSVFVGH